MNGGGGVPTFFALGENFMETRRGGENFQIAGVPRQGYELHPLKNQSKETRGGRGEGGSRKSQACDLH